MGIRLRTINTCKANVITKVICECCSRLLKEIVVLLKLVYCRASVVGFKTEHEFKIRDAEYEVFQMDGFLFERVTYCVISNEFPVGDDSVCSICCCRNIYKHN